MKILQFITSLGVGGAENLIMNYCKYLKNNGHDVRVLVLVERLDTYIEKQIEEYGIEIKYLNNPIKRRRSVLTSKIQTFLRILKQNDYLKHYLEEERFDVIHMHTGTYNVLFRIPSKYYKSSKLFYTCHTVPHIHFSNLDKRKIKWALRNTNLQLIALNNDFKHEIEKMFKCECIVIPNGIDFAKFKHIDIENVKAITREYKLQNRFVVGSVGRFVDVKNHLFLLDVFSEIKKKDDSAVLVLVGNGELYNKIIETAKSLEIGDDIVVLSNRNDVQDIMSIFDVLVMPSKYEGFPITLIEAQVIGIPCVISSRIPANCVVNSNVCKLELEDSKMHWAESVLSNNKKIKYDIRLEQFDFPHVVNSLLEIYSR